MADDLIVKTLYKELFDSVYSKMQDQDLKDLLEEEADNIIKEYLEPAITNFECCDQNLNDRDEANKCFNFELSVVNKEILATFMVYQYIRANYVLVTEMLRAHMSTTDFHKYDNANVLTRVTEIQNDLYKRNKQLMINYSIRNSDSEFAKLYAEKGSYNPSKYSRKSTTSHCCKRWF